MLENNLVSEEVWRDVVGFEGLYQISSWGKVKSLPRRGRKERILKPFLSISRKKTQFFRAGMNCVLGDHVSVAVLVFPRIVSIHLKLLHHTMQ